MPQHSADLNKILAAQQSPSGSGEMPVDPAGAGGASSIAWNTLQCILRDFEQAWAQGKRPTLSDYLPKSGRLRTVVLLELAITELELRLKAGEPATASEYLRRFPELARSPDAALQLFDVEAVCAEGAAVQTRITADSEATPNLCYHLTPTQLDRYELLEVVGQGSFGVVYRARDVKLRRTVALKVPHPGRLAHSHDADRFLREARVAAKLSHPFIVSIHDAGQIDGRCYLVSEYIAGITLAERLAAGALPPRAAAELTARVAQALTHAHEHGVVHRDLKPSNILLDALGQPRLTDFGLAKHEADESTLTMEGQVLGTPAYISPEQARGEGHTASARSDTYSLGVILYQALTGEPPFRGNVRMVLDQVQNDEPRPPRRLNDLVPRDLETICLKAMAKEPRHRYDSALELAEDLERFLRGEPILARPVSRRERLYRWARRRPAIAALSVLVVATTLFGFAGIAWQWRQAESARKLVAVKAEAEGKTRAALEENLYFYRISLAEREIQAGNVARANDLLDLCPAESRGWEWNYLKRRQVLGDRAHVVYSEGVRLFRTAFSADQRWLAVTRWDGQVVVRDLATGRPFLKLQTSKEPAHTARFDPTGKWLLTSDGDGQTTLWGMPDGRRLHTWKDHRGGVWDAVFSHDGQWIASGDNEGGIIVRRSEDGRVLWSLKAHEDRIWALEFSPDGTRLASASTDGVLAIWEAASGRLERRLRQAVDYPLWCVSFSPDGARIASSDASGHVNVWDAASGTLLAKFQLSTLTVTTISFSPDGSRLAFAGAEGIVTICDAQSYHETIRLYGHTQGIWGISFSSDCSLIATSSWDGTVRIWNAHTLDSRETPELLVFQSHEGKVFDVKFAPNRDEIASAGDDGLIRICDARSGRERIRLAGHTGGPTSLAYDREGRWIVSGGYDRTARVWDSETGLPLMVLTGHTGIVFGVAISPDGSLIATAGWDRTTRVWDALTGKPLHVFNDELGFSMDVAFSPDGSLLASAGNERVRIWDPRSGRLVQTIHADTETVHVVAFDPRGERLALGAKDGGITIVDLATGKARLRMRGEYLHQALAFTADGKWLASAGWSRNVQVWNAETGEILAELRGHTDRLFGLSISPDGRRIASCGGDQTIRVWRAPWIRDVPEESAGAGSPGRWGSAGRGNPSHEGE